MVTTSANGLSKTASVDGDGAVSSSGAAVFNLVTTDVTVLDSDGRKTETFTNSNGDDAVVDYTVTTTSADKQTVTYQRQDDETGTLATVDQTETRQTNADGTVTDTRTTTNAAGASLGSIVTTARAKGLATTATYTNGSGTVVDSQSDTTTFDSDGDGGSSEDFAQSENVDGATLNGSVETTTSANGQFAMIAMALSGALASSGATSYSAVASEATEIADDGSTTRTVADSVDGAASPSDTTTTLVSADRLTTTISTALCAAAPYVTSVSTTNLDGSTNQTVTYLNPADLSLVESSVGVATSWDGRRTTVQKQTD